MRQPESRQDIIVVSVSKEHILAFIVYFYSTLQIKVQVTFHGMGEHVVTVHDKAMNSNIGCKVIPQV